MGLFCLHDYVTRCAALEAVYLCTSWDSPKDDQHVKYYLEQKGLLEFSEVFEQAGMHAEGCRRGWGLQKRSPGEGV